MKSNIMLLIVVLVFACSASAFNVSYPLCSIGVSVETIVKTMIFVVTLLTLLVAFILVFLKRVLPVVFFVTILSLVVSVLTTQFRSSKNEVQNWVFDGKVEQKYRSENHNARAMLVDGVVYESVPVFFWDKIAIGDYVVKGACSSQVKLNGIVVDRAFSF